MEKNPLVDDHIPELYHTAIVKLILLVLGFSLLPDIISEHND